MADDPQGTPSNEAPGLDTSPTLDSGTPSGPASGVNTEEFDALRLENEQLRNRVSQGTRTFQENQRLQAEIHAHNERLARWKTNYGVDLDELERSINPNAVPTDTGSRRAESPQGVTEDGVDEKLFWHGAMLQYDLEKKDFFKSNPDLDTKEFRDYFDLVSTGQVRNEMAEYGRPISTPEQVRKVAEKALKKHVDAMEQRVAKRLEETRTKVAGQGVVDSTTRKPDKSSGDDDDAKNMTNEDYADFARSHTNKIRSPRL